MVYSKTKLSFLLVVFITNYFLLNAQYKSEFQIIDKSINLTNDTTTNDNNNKSEEELAFSIKDVLDDSITSTTPNDYLTSMPSQTQSEPLNQYHGNTFKSWLELKSIELHELNMNFSGFKILNDTYYSTLPKEASFEWINFTDMIVNISKNIGEVLYNKTLVVKNLSDFVERAYEQYTNDSEKIKLSLNFRYYHAKSPKTFCDLAENSSTKNAKLPAKTTEISGKNDVTFKTNGTKIQKRSKRSSNFDMIDFDYMISKNTKTKQSKISDEKTLSSRLRNYKSESVNVPEHRPVSPHRHHNPHHAHKDETSKELERKNRKITVKNVTTTKRPPRKYTKVKPTTTTTPTTTTPPMEYVDDSEYEGVNYEDEGPDDSEDPKSYWDVPCINRTNDENFKTIRLVSRNYSTIHVPINVYRQDMAINMTAYWTESLNEQFKINYDNDNELFWQYFCSSLGLFRRYPGAQWKVNIKEDFFDCRLQTWYIMAAASPKDALILLDTSGSMTGLRLEIAKKLVESILDTFTDNDFFNIMTFSASYQFLFHNETDYVDNFVQAGKANKLKYKQKLQSFKNTSLQATLTEPLKKSFELFNNSNLVRNGCNKMLMIITDGHADKVDEVFRKYNSEKRVRVFSFKIGRDMTDPTEIKKLACDNNGEYYHVVTLTDINEHVYEYIPVLSRPMALTAVHETTWSNVFIGFLDRELKIAVARPAFKSSTSLLAKLKKRKNLKTNFQQRMKSMNLTSFMYSDQLVGNLSLFDNFTNQSIFDEIVEVSDNDDDLDQFDYIYEDSEENKSEYQMRKAYKILNKQPVLLGVVGVDVPVLRLISKVSPKYQMGVGIYIIMLDNNGFIVFHPSIKQEIADSVSDFKATSHSIDLDKFEIPINNDEEFDNLEHEMIDQKTNKKTLDNWKREGARVIKRKTEYVYTPVLNTPFSVAIASPSSFGRFYIDIPLSKEKDYEQRIREILLEKKKFDSLVQLYNCSYPYARLSERLTNFKQQTDYCIRYLNQDVSQIVAIKSDLVLHNHIYHQYNFSLFSVYKNLVKSIFYGTYSGITFYLPVTFYRPKLFTTSTDSSTTFTTSNTASTTTPESNNKMNTNNGSTTTELSNSTTTVPLTINSTTIDLDTTTVMITTTQATDLEEDEPYNQTLNLFSTESNKHTYSFEKKYYTRSIEFSDYLRTSYQVDEPIAIYFLNESSKETRNESISVSIPIWLDKVPTAVTGVIYDAKSLEEILFMTPPNCEQDSCINICNRKPELNVTCYLVDEHAIVVLSSSEQTNIIGQPLYKVNPWLMLQLEFDGLYDLIVKGNKLQDCTKPPITFNTASKLFNLVNLLLKTIMYLFNQAFLFLFDGISHSIKTFLTGLTLFDANYLNHNVISLINAQSSASRQGNQEDKSKINKVEWKIRNSHCFYFGIYSFNITKWKMMDSSELKVWCNSSEPRRYLAGYLKFSNLMMLVVEEEHEMSKCGSINILSQQRPPDWNTRLANKNPRKNSSNNKTEKNNYTINRYRKKPDYCHNYFPNESLIFTCASSFHNPFYSGYIYLALTKYTHYLIFIYFFIFKYLN